MLAESTRNVGSNSRVERIVAAANYIEIPHNKHRRIARDIAASLASKRAIACASLHKRFFVIIAGRWAHPIGQAVRRHRQMAVRQIKTLKVEGHLNKAAAGNKVSRGCSHARIDVTVCSQHAVQRSMRCAERLSPFDKALRWPVKRLRQTRLIGRHAADGLCVERMCIRSSWRSKPASIKRSCSGKKWGSCTPFQT